jgi:hypothetical protein
MTMGTIASPWHYDAAASIAIQPVYLRRPAIHDTLRACLTSEIARKSSQTWRRPYFSPMGQKRPGTYNFPLGVEPLVAGQSMVVGSK